MRGSYHHNREAIRYQHISKFCRTSCRIFRPAGLVLFVHKSGRRWDRLSLHLLKRGVKVVSRLPVQMVWVQLSVLAALRPLALRRV